MGAESLHVESVPIRRACAQKFRRRGPGRAFVILVTSITRIWKVPEMTILGRGRHIGRGSRPGTGSWRALGADYAARSEQQALRERPVIAPNNLLPMPPPCRCDDGGKMMIAAARCVKSAGRQTGTEARAWQRARRRTKLHGVGHLSRACDRRAGALWSSKGRSPPVVGLQPYGDRRASPTVSPAISQVGR